MTTFPPIIPHVEAPESVKQENDVGPDDDDGDEDDRVAALVPS